MSVNVKVLITVIWITFLSVEHSSAVSLISSQMRDDLKRCPFPTDNVKEYVDSMCNLVIPDPKRSLAVKFQLANYFCMELYDVSLQLCDRKFESHFPKPEDDKNIYLPKADEFCSQLNFSETRSKKTGAWADVAIINLKNPDICTQFCVVDGDLNLLCASIYIANQLLMDLNLEPPLMVGTEHPEISANENVPVQNDNLPDQEHDKSQHLDGTNSIGKESQKNSVDESHNPKQSNESINNLVKETINHSNTNEYIPENRMEQGMAKTNQSNSLQVGIQLVSNEQNKGLTKGFAAGSTSKMSSNVSTSGTETHYKSVANAPTDEHTEVKGETIKSREMGEIAGNDGISQFTDDIIVDGITKGVNVEDPISPSVAQEDNYDGDDESPQNVAGSNNGHPYYNIKPYPDTFVDAQDSHFFAYFLTMVVICIIGYLVFHNKQKIIALALEGRRMQGSRRRPNTSSYKKLDSNLEEAVTSTCSSSSVTHVIF